MSKHLVELHGGGLTIESKPGAGTTVRATFPVERLRHGDQNGAEEKSEAEEDTGEGDDSPET